MNRRQLLDKLEEQDREHEHLHSILNVSVAARKNLHAVLRELQSDCECLRKERDVAQNELARVQSDRARLDEMYGARGKQLERYSEMCGELCRERNKLRAERDSLQSFHDKTLPLLEEYQFERAELCAECYEARALARLAYSLLRDWGGVCICGSMLKFADDWKCPKCNREKQR